MVDIKLNIENRIFTVSKELLTTNSSYFRAMFSGKFKEDTQDEISIEIISAESMDNILFFLKENYLDFADIRKLRELLLAAFFLQIDKLIDAIVIKLSDNIDIDNWLNIYEISEQAGLHHLLVKAKTFGLCEFTIVRRNMSIFKNLSQLHWYLSNRSLLVTSEIDVFTAGCSWIMENKSNDSSIVVILCCLDYTQISDEDLKIMLQHELVQEKSFAQNILNGLLDIKCYQNVTCRIGDLECSSILKKYGSDVHKVILHLFKGNQRLPKQRPCIVGTLDNKPKLFQYNIDNNKLEKVLDLDTETWWGYTMLSWSGYKMLMFGGECRKGPSYFSPDLKIYDSIQRRWTVIMNAFKESRRHAGAVVHGDVLYVVGGVGSFRVVLSSGLAYDLRKNMCTKLPALPEEVQSPAVAIHKNELYFCGHQNIYVLKNTTWLPVFKVRMKCNFILPCRDYIYMTHNFTNQISYFNPNDKAEEVETKSFKYQVAALCKAGGNIYAFTEDTDFEKQHHHIEWCNLEDGICIDNQVLWHDASGTIAYYNVAGSSPLTYCVKEDEFVNTCGLDWVGFESTQSPPRDCAPKSCDTFTS